ncbi:g5081 [Coccomyxa viridis]|uniref:G5081 protein n=1 Tax=Coccomyxa viridis TaxID=1274662 RepID=A0ABP1FUH6_9CHLO
MGEAFYTSRKTFLLIGHAAGESRDVLRRNLTRLCQAQGLSMGSLTASDGLAFIQAVASGCQVICLEESVPECPAAASFAATAALSGYALTMRRLSQQGSGKSLCKLYCMQAGQESLLAAAIIAPILFRETIFGLPRQHSAGGLQVAPAQPQQADANGVAPLMLAGQPHEPADASSGQTQQLLRTTPQHCNGHDRQRRDNEEGGLPPSAGEQHDPKDAGCLGKDAAAPDASGIEPSSARGGAAGREENPAADGPDEQQPDGPDAGLPHPGVAQPADEQTEVVDLISDSDDERANVPASQAAAPRTGQAVPPKGGREEALRGAGAARRSARISSQCESDAGESNEEQRRSKRPKAWLKGHRKREPKAEPPKAKKSRLGKAPQTPAAPAARQSKPNPVKARAAAASGKRVAKPKPPPPQTQVQQLKKPQVRQDPKDSKAGGVTGAQIARCLIKVPQDESSEWSSEAEGADQPLEQEDGAVQSSKAPVKTTPVGAAKAETAQPPSSAARPAGKTPAPTPQHPPKAQAAEKHGTPLPQSAAKVENAKAVTPPQAPASSTAPASVKPEDSPIKSRVPYSEADVVALLAAFEQNRCSQAASQSPAKKCKREDKGKGKMSEMPRDPGQPGPSNAVYCTPAEEVDFSDDDSEGWDLMSGLL